MAADGFTLSHPRQGRPQVLDRARQALPPDRGGHGPRAARAPASTTSGSPTGPRKSRSTGPPTATACASRSTRSSQIELRPAADARTRSRASSSASAPSPSSSARTSSTWATPSPSSKLVCLDLGHFHPTESVADKISALLPFCPAWSSTSAAASAGTATTSSSSTTRSWP